MKARWDENDVSGPEDQSLCWYMAQTILVDVEVIAVKTQLVEQFVPDWQKTIRNWVFSGLLYINK